jgi:hypothetical protein
MSGVVDGEWPDRSRRSIFYSPAVLRELGWPSEADRLAGARAAFADLLRLPTSRLSVSVFALEADSLVGPSPFTDEVEQSGLDSIEEEASTRRIFDYEAMCQDPADEAPLGVHARDWMASRLRPTTRPPDRFRGITAPPPARAYSLSALERYQDCPFKFFAADVLRLEESPEDESTLSPRARGRFIHGVQALSVAERGSGAISPTVSRKPDARGAVAEPLLARLPDADAALSARALRIGDLDGVWTSLGHEASGPVQVGALARAPVRGDCLARKTDDGGAKAWSSADLLGGTAQIDTSRAARRIPRARCRCNLRPLRPGHRRSRRHPGPSPKRPTAFSGSGRTSRGQGRAQSGALNAAASVCSVSSTESAAASSAAAP